VVSSKNYPYAFIICTFSSNSLARILGFQYPLQQDEIDVITRGRIIFNEAQTLWKTNCVEKGIKVKGTLIIISSNVSVKMTLCTTSGMEVTATSSSCSMYSPEYWIKKEESG